MSNIVFNIAKGRVVELYSRVKSNDPTDSALILVPLEASGLEADATLIDKDDLAAVLPAGKLAQLEVGGGGGVSPPRPPLFLPSPFG